MSNIWVEFEVKVPADNEERRKEKVKKARHLIEARAQTLQKSAANKSLESVGSLRYERRDSPVREKWVIYAEGEGDIKEYARGFQKDLSGILAEDDFLRVTLSQDE